MDATAGDPSSISNKPQVPLLLIMKPGKRGDRTNNHPGAGSSVTAALEYHLIHKRPESNVGCNHMRVGK